MSPEQVVAVRDSFARLAPQADAVGLAFYGRLFALDPSLRRLFAADIAPQAKKLMQMIGYAVARLDRPDELIPAVEALGRRHRGYGVAPAHYDTVAAALLATLADGLGAAFTPAVREAWTAAYTALATAMQQGASEAAAS
jgi:nitric oxide dioxygenase